MRVTSRRVPFANGENISCRVLLAANATDCGVGGEREGRGGRAQEAGGQVHLRQQGQRVQLQPESEANWSRQLQAGMRLAVAVMQAGRQAGGMMACWQAGQAPPRGCCS